MFLSIRLLCQPLMQSKLWSLTVFPGDYTNLDDQFPRKRDLMSFPYIHVLYVYVLINSGKLWYFSDKTLLFAQVFIY